MERSSLATGSARVGLLLGFVAASLIVAGVVWRLSARNSERQVHQAALGNGILKVATHNALTTMTSFLRGLGFEQIDVR